MLSVKTPEDEWRQLESDPLRNPEPVEFLEQRRHVIELPSTENKVNIYKFHDDDDDDDDVTDVYIV